MAKKFKGLEKKQFYGGAMRWMGVGFEFCMVCGLFAWGGSWLDKLEKNTGSGWMIIGFFVGFGLMLYIIVKRAQHSNEQMDSDNQEDSSDQK